MPDQLFLLKMLVVGKNQPPFHHYQHNKNKQVSRTHYKNLGSVPRSKNLLKYLCLPQANFLKEQKGSKTPNPPKLQCPNPHKFK